MAGHGAPLGNQFWKQRSSHGRKPTFADGETLWAACEEYFDWVHDNPLQADNVISYEGVATHEPLDKMRAMTLDGLYIFLDIGKSTWKTWRDNDALKETVERVEMIIRTQKFEGAAAGLLNQAIIARDLGLVEKTASELSGANGGPIQTTAQLDASQLTKEQLIALASIRIPTDGG